MHSAWTYYGTSGGPLFYRGKLIGLHSSWDSATSTRHGVHYRAILPFLEQIEIYDYNNQQQAQAQAQAASVAAGKSSGGGPRNRKRVQKLGPGKKNGASCATININTDSNSDNSSRRSSSRRGRSASDPADVCLLPVIDPNAYPPSAGPHPALSFLQNLNVGSATGSKMPTHSQHRYCINNVHLQGAVTGTGCVNHGTFAPS
jgi:hypothetical protein